MVGLAPRLGISSPSTMTRSSVSVPQLSKAVKKGLFVSWAILITFEGSYIDLSDNDGIEVPLRWSESSAEDNTAVGCAAACLLRMVQTATDLQAFTQSLRWNASASGWNDHIQTKPDVRSFLAAATLADHIHAPPAAHHNFDQLCMLARVVGGSQ